MSSHFTDNKIRNTSGDSGSERAVNRVAEINKYSELQTIMATATTGSGGLGLLFSNIEKFTGTADLVSWIKQFDRCCVVANKTDDAVKGQLLMLCVAGQAKAILENFEEDQNGAQGYNALKGELEKHYNTTAIKEGKMREFEVRTQKVDESEEESCLSCIIGAKEQTLLSQQQYN